MVRLTHRLRDCRCHVHRTLPTARSEPVRPSSSRWAMYALMPSGGANMVRARSDHRCDAPGWPSRGDASTNTRRAHAAATNA